MQTLSQAQFAKHINVDRSYITQLKQAGRLVMTEKGLVDVESSMLLIAETADPNRDDVSSRHAQERGKDTLVHEIGMGNLSKKQKPIYGQDVDKLKFLEGRAKEQHYKALAAELEYAKSIGEMVSTADMQMAVADVVTSFRQKLENLPHNLCQELVAQDQDFIRNRLRQECHDILSELSREFMAKIESRGQETV